MVIEVVVVFGEFGFLDFDVVNFGFVDFGFVIFLDGFDLEIVVLLVGDIDMVELFVDDLFFGFVDECEMVCIIVDVGIIFGVDECEYDFVIEDVVMFLVVNVDLLVECGVVE